MCAFPSCHPFDVKRTVNVSRPADDCATVGLLLGNSNSSRLDGRLVSPQSFPHLWKKLWKIHRNRDDASDRKSTRLNSSHQIISYAVFCLKKKKTKKQKTIQTKS